MMGRRSLVCAEGYKGLVINYVEGYEMGKSRDEDKEKPFEPPPPPPNRYG